VRGKFTLMKKRPLGGDGIRSLPFRQRGRWKKVGGGKKSTCNTKGPPKLTEKELGCEASQTWRGLPNPRTSFTG